MNQVLKTVGRLRRIGGSARWVVLLTVVIAVIVFIVVRDKPGGSKGKSTSPVQVTLATVTTGDLPRMIEAKGNVAALQSVDIKPQVAATVVRVAFEEGQNVNRGDRLYVLDMAQAKANLTRAEAQALKSRTDLTNLERSLQRQRDLFNRNFISQSQLDVAQSQADSARAQLAADIAAAEAARIAAAFGDIRAPIAGRAGANAVYPGSYVQPSGGALVTITQIDPIAVTFFIPERDLPSVQEAMKTARPDVEIRDGRDGTFIAKGRLSFIDNAVDSVSGTIRIKAEVANAGALLWPGMFVTVRFVPSVIKAASLVPVKALQLGGANPILYSVGDDMTVQGVSVKLLHVHEGVAAVEGIKSGARIVVEGIQNLRKGSSVIDASAVPKSSAQPEVKSQ